MMITASISEKCWVNKWDNWCENPLSIFRHKVQNKSNILLYYYTIIIWEVYMILYICAFISGRYINFMIWRNWSYLFLPIQIWLVMGIERKFIFCIPQNSLPFCTSQIFHMNNAWIHICVECFMFIHVIFLIWWRSYVHLQTWKLEPLTSKNGRFRYNSSFLTPSPQKVKYRCFLNWQIIF